LPASSGRAFGMLHILVELTLVGDSFRRKGLSRLHPDTAALRPGEELNLPSLADWVRGRIAGSERGITLEPFPGGHSNLTYLLQIDGVGEDTVTRRFAKVKGVIDLGSPETPKRRRYRVLRIPKAVVEKLVLARSGGIVVEVTAPGRPQKASRQKVLKTPARQG